MAVRLIPASKIMVCDICLTEQQEPEATQPFGKFTYQAAVTMSKTLRGGTVIPLKFDTCNDCMESVSRYVTSLLVVARGGIAEAASNGEVL